MKKIEFCVCLVLLVGVNAFCGEMRIADIVDFDLFGKKLGSGWVRRKGLVIESESAIEKLPKEYQGIARMVYSRMKPHGAIGCGDFTFARSKAPLNYVTIRVFKFASAEKAVAFGKLKYEGESFKSRYRKTLAKPDVTYDSLKRKKRVVIHGQYMVTAEHGGKDDLHAVILQECINFGDKKKKAAEEGNKKQPVKNELLKEFKNYGFSMKCSDKLITNSYLVNLLEERVHYGVVMHAKAKGVAAEKVRSDILFYQSLHKIDAGKDNPNITVSVENNWQGAKYPTGKDYLELIADRLKTFKISSEFKGEMQKKQINGNVFYVQDVVNKRFKGADTKQKYYATYHKGNYIVFVVSYNDEKSETFKLFESVIKSFKVPGKKGKSSVK